MITLLIVDDEEIIREGLKEYIPWQEAGIKIVGTAEDGLDALEKIKSLKPDIVMADIRMPRMDGLQLAQRIKIFAPDIKVIFLTGYDDFSYAQQAITIGADDYILKPVSSDELFECLDRVKGKLLNEQKMRAEREALKQHINESLPFLKPWFFSAIRSGEEDIWKKLSFLSINFEKGRFLSIVITIDNPDDQEDYYTLFKLYNNVSIIVGNESNFRAATFFEESLFTILLNFPFDGMRDLSRPIIDITYKIKDLMDYSFNGSYTIGVGKVVDDIRQMENSYKSALEACEYRFYVGENQIIYINDVEPMVKEHEHPSLSDEEFIMFIKTANEQKAVDYVKEVFDNMKKRREDIDWVKKVSLELIVYMSRAIYEVGENPNVLFHKTDPWYEINKRLTIDQLYEFMIDVTITVVSHLSYQRKTRNQKIVEQVKVLINENYGMDVSLEYISEKVYISPCYLSSIFSQETGETFKEYLTKVRMEKAKELLKNISLKVYEVSQQVGYSDPHYFSQVFKKYTGMTPAQYRNL